MPLDEFDAILERCKSLTDDIKGIGTQYQVPATPGTTYTSSVSDNGDSLMEELNDIFKSDPELFAILKKVPNYQQPKPFEPPAPSASTSYKPPSIEEIEQDIFSNTQHLQPEIQKQALPQPENINFTHSLAKQAITKQQTAEKPIHAVWDEIERTAAQRIAEKHTEPVITEKQLKILNRKHLLTMIFDLQDELIKLRKENEKIITAYRAGLARMRG